MEKLPGKLGRIVTASPLEPRAVFRGNEGGQPLAVVVRRDRCQATAADREDTRALGLDATTRLEVVGLANERFVSHADLQRQRALAGLGQELVRLEADPGGPFGIIMHEV